MTALFTLPGQTPLNLGVVIPGAKLTFSQTGTSTLQNTYQEEALTTPHANPVVADANGLFAAIYLDPTLPSYRATLTTAADVLIKQWDGIPSTFGVQQSMRLESTNPNLFFYDTDGTANARKYRIRASGNAFFIQSSNDAESVFTDILAVDSTGLAGGKDGNFFIVENIAPTDFTGTLTGMASATTATFRAYRFFRTNGTGGFVYLINPGAAVTGTSNATTMTLTGLPAGIRTARGEVACSVTDNGNNFMSAIATFSSDTITFRIARTDAVANFSQYLSTGFTNSGTKGLASNWALFYAIQ